MISVLRLLVGAIALLVAGITAAARGARRPRRPRPVPRPAPAWRAPAQRPPRSQKMRAAQAVLAASAILVIAFGLLVMLQTVRWTHYVGLLVWLAAAVVLHDAVLVPVVTGLRAALQARARRLPAGAVVVLQGAFVVGAVLSLAVLPEVWAQHLGTRNPTVLPVDYLARLAVVWAVLLAVGLVAVLAGTARERRRLRPLGAPGEKVGPPRARPAGAP